MLPESHEKITEFAANIYISRGGWLAGDFNETRLKSAVLKGTRYEDNITPSRALNWHFYPANETIVREKRDIFNLITLRPTSDWIVSKRQKKVIQLLEEGTSPSLYRALGRVLHHIQDMNTPSHVIPIYHDHDTKDAFESYLVDHWLELERRLVDSEERFGQVMEERYSGDFVSLYNDAGRRLLKNLEPDGALFPVTINRDRISVSSIVFWLPYAGAPTDNDVPLHIDGFGSFGPLGQKFGSRDSVVADGLTVSVDPDVYQDIALFFVSLAIEDTLRGILVFEKMSRE